MSRHLLIRCDAPGCLQQTETSARDDAPTAVEVPSGWYTLIAPERPHRHYCSEACIGAAFALKAPTSLSTALVLPVVEPAPVSAPETPATRKVARHVAHPD